MISAQMRLCFTDAGYSELLEKHALQPLLEGMTEITAGQQEQWQGDLPLQALAALAAHKSHLRSHIMSSIQQMLPTLLAASVGSTHNQQMLIGILDVISHKLAPFEDGEGEVATAVAVDLLTGVLQLTKVGFVPQSRKCTSLCVLLCMAIWSATGFTKCFSRFHCNSVWPSND